VQGVNSSDDELWRAIAENTNSLSVLLNKPLESDNNFVAANDRRLMIGKLEREYRDLTAKLRHRYAAAA
jgi:hypothetical protein